MTPNSEKTPSLRVFVVENDADTLKYLRHRLERLGHTVCYAKCMNEALAAIPSANCNVLLSDIGLPDGDGWELMRTVELTSPIFSIAMSGYGMESDLQKSKAAGFRHHLVKPFPRHALEALLAQAAAELQA